MQKYYGNSRFYLQLSARGEIEEEQYIEVARIGSEHNFERFTYLLFTIAKLSNCTGIESFAITTNGVS